MYRRGVRPKVQEVEISTSFVPHSQSQVLADSPVLQHRHVSSSCDMSRPRQEQQTSQSIYAAESVNNTAMLQTQELQQLAALLHPSSPQASRTGDVQQQLNPSEAGFINSLIALEDESEDLLLWLAFLPKHARDVPQGCAFRSRSLYESVGYNHHDHESVCGSLMLLRKYLVLTENT